MQLLAYSPPAVGWGRELEGKTEISWLEGKAV